jgi:hypothetical protein
VQNAISALDEHISSFSALAHEDLLGCIDLRERQIALEDALAVSQHRLSAQRARIALLDALRRTRAPPSIETSVATVADSQRRLLEREATHECTQHLELSEVSAPTHNALK